MEKKKKQWKVIEKNKKKKVVKKILKRKSPPGKCCECKKVQKKYNKIRKKVLVSLLNEYSLLT